MKQTAALKITTPSERELVMTRDFAAPRGMLFDALTKPDLVQRWLLGPPGWTMPVCEIDLRVGGKYRYVWRNADGREMGMGGTFKEIVRPSRLVATETYEDYWTGGETLVTTELVETRDKTSLSTTVRYASREARDAAMKMGATKGLEASYDRLDQLLTA
ncbi:MAG TPA: SRPBCC family protein [Gemmatimonadales bacterium]|nr:SRPBCC family protein [Gemmatimonadales bacterium]